MKPKKANEQMALITSEARAEALEQRCEDIARTLQDMQDELEALRGRFRDGDLDDRRAGQSLFADIRYWLKQARETEQELDKIRREDAGLAGDYGLDLHAARFEVGCRLARIRRCCREGRLSE